MVSEGPIIKLIMLEIMLKQTSRYLFLTTQ